jgi:sulfoxide reductase heme-binding subunit YedZ
MRFTRFQILVHIASWIPFLLMVWDYFQSNLTINPIQELTLRTGKTALILLVLSLACTPLNIIFGWKEVNRVRRPLGLYAFMYAALHYLIYIGLDYGFNFKLIVAELSQKRYVLVGFTAGLILSALAITSTKGWQKRLKRNWKKLHTFVYLAGILVVVHYTWLVKSDIREPLIYGAVVLVLLVVRIPYIRKKLSRVEAIKFSNLKKMFRANILRIEDGVSS